MKEENKKKTTAKKSTSTTTKKKPVKKTNSAKKSSTPISEQIKGREEQKEVVTSNEKNTNSSIKNEERTIYVLRIISIILATILIIVAGVKLFFSMKETKYSDEWLNKSYLVEKGITEKVTCNELSQKITGDHKFIFITNYSEEEFELEKDLSKILKEYHLEDKFYVYQVDESCRASALNSLQVTEFSKVPTIYYYRNGLLNYKVEREDSKMMEAADFVQLLDIYEFKK